MRPPREFGFELGLRIAAGGRGATTYDVVSPAAKTDQHIVYVAMLPDGKALKVHEGHITENSWHLCQNEVAVFQNRNPALGVHRKTVRGSLLACGKVDELTIEVETGLLKRNMGCK